VRYSYDAAGLASLFRFRYQTDGGAHNPGAFIDDVEISAGKAVILSDDAEHGQGQRLANGQWQLSTGSVTRTTEQYYLVSAHPGAGSTLPVDARPATFKWPDGTVPDNSRQPFDATFGLEATDPLCLAKEVQTGTKRNPGITSVDACAVSSAAIGVLKDIDPLAYYSADNPYGSVKVAGQGVEIAVTSDAGSDLAIHVVNPGQD
jgi:immune inhibitor A